MIVPTIICETCHKEMILIGNEEMGYYFDCNQGCGMIDAEHHLNQANLFPYKEPPTTHCWDPKCNTTIKRVITNRDGYYGNFCPECNKSLRTHYHLGEGKPGDLAKRFQK